MKAEHWLQEVSRGADLGSYSRPGSGSGGVASRSSPSALGRHPRRRLYTANPSLRARKLWTYVLGLGCARCRPGEQTESADNRPGYLLHYLRCGQVEYTIKGRHFLLGPGSACLLERRESYRLRTTSNHSAQLWRVLFNSGSDLAPMYTELGVDFDHVFPLSTRDRFEKSFHDLWGLIIHPTDSSEVQSHVLLQQLIAELFIARTGNCACKAGSGKRAR